MLTLKIGKIDLKFLAKVSLVGLHTILFLLNTYLLTSQKPIFHGTHFWQQIALL